MKSEGEHTKGEFDRDTASEGSFADIRNMTLFECTVNVFKALIDEVGPNLALEAIRPLNNFGGKYSANAVKQMFGLQGNDAEAVAMPYYLFHCATSSGRIKPMEIREGNAIVELNACPTTRFDAPPEMCVAVSHYIAEGICEEINPSYEFVFTHHLANGDDCCRYVVKKKSGKFDLDNPGKLEKIIPLELPQEMMDMLMEGVAFGQMGVFTLASIELTGSERTMELMLPLARKTGIQLGTKLRREAGRDVDLLMLRDRLDFICCPLSRGESQAKISKLGIENEITECPFMQWLPANSTCPPEVCMQIDEILKGACEAMNPDYEFIYDRMTSKGDKTCHWLVRKKREPTKKDAPEVQKTFEDDHLKILKIRFAKGEITEAEYDRLRDKLSK